MYNLGEKRKWGILQEKYPSPKCNKCQQDNETETHFWIECKGWDPSRRKIEEKAKKKCKTKDSEGFYNLSTDLWIREIWDIGLPAQIENEEREALRRSIKFEAWE